MTTISQRLEEGTTVLMDGATGTELERNGVPMNSIAWSGPRRSNRSRTSFAKFISITFAPAPKL